MFVSLVILAIALCDSNFSLEHPKYNFPLIFQIKPKPLGSMYGILAYIYHKKSTLHVGKYTIP